MNDTVLSSSSERNTEDNHSSTTPVATSVKSKMFHHRSPFRVKNDRL